MIQGSRTSKNIKKKRKKYKFLVFINTKNLMLELNNVEFNTTVSRRSTEERSIDRFANVPFARVNWKGKQLPGTASFLKHAPLCPRKWSVERWKGENGCEERSRFAWRKKTAREIRAGTFGCHDWLAWNAHAAMFIQHRPQS